MDEADLWKTLWTTVEGRPENAFRHALNRCVPQALAETRAASPSARIPGFSGVNHRTYSAIAAPSMSVYAQTSQQRVDNLWICRYELWRKDALNDCARSSPESESVGHFRFRWPQQTTRPVDSSTRSPE